MHDLISRQAAIDALERYKNDDPMYSLDENVQGWNEGLDTAVELLKELPTAQPEGYTDQLRWERDVAIQQLKELGYGLGEKIRTDGDTISRQAAIDAVYKCTDIFINNLPVMVDKADAYKALAELPSAHPEVGTQMSAPDCISREAAIELTWERPTYNDPLNVLTELRDKLRELPSAQTEHATCYLDSPCEYQNINIALPSAEPEITRCRECKHKDKKIDYCHYLGITICECDYCSYAVRRTDG